MAESLLARPMVVAAAAFVAGTLALQAPPAVAIGVLAALGIAGAVLAQRASRDALHRALPAAALAVVCGTAGAVRYAQATAVRPDDMSLRREGYVAVAGTVAGEPDATPLTAGGRRFILAVAAAGQSPDSMSPASGRLLVTVAGDGAASAQEGASVVAEGSLERPLSHRNPGGFDYAAWRARNGVPMDLYCAAPDQVRFGPPGGGWSAFVHFAGSLRRALLHPRWSRVPRPARAAAAGVLFGDRSGLLPAQRRDLERTQTMHAVATGGLHMAAMVAAALLLARWVLPRRRLQAAAGIAAACFYAFLAGGRPSVMRAAAVLVIGLGAELFEREPDWPSAIAAAALLQLVPDPRALGDAGFQFTFAAAIALAAGANAIRRVSEAVQGAAPRVMRRFAGVAAQYILMSAVVAAGVAPVTAAATGRVSLTGIAANVLVVPLLPWLLFAALVDGVLGSMAPWLAWAPDHVLTWTATLFLWIVRLFSHAPGAVRASGSVAPAAAALCVAGFAWAAWRVGTLASRRRAALWLGVSVAGVYAALSVRAPRPHQLRVTFLDVGQGDAAVVESPSGVVLLVDTGGVLHNGDDEGSRTVEPFLASEGISRADAIVETHPHADHIGGVPSLLEDIDVGQVLDDGDDTGTPLEQRVAAEAAAAHAPLRHLLRGEAIDLGGGVRADVVAPTLGETSGPPNNASVVLRIAYGSTVFLFTGDAEAPEEDEMLAAREPVACTVLKVGHHGSATSTTPEFLAAARPAVALISVGARNRYGHPSPDVVARLRASGARVYRTDENGALVCTSDGVSVTCTPMVP